MKAFSIKKLGYTNTLPNRVKVSYPQNGSKTYSNSSDKPLSVFIDQFCLDNGLTVHPYTIGQISNGDYVATWNKNK